MWLPGDQCLSFLTAHPRTEFFGNLVDALNLSDPANPVDYSSNANNLFDPMMHAFAHSHGQGRCS